MLYMISDSLFTKTIIIYHKHHTFYVIYSINEIILLIYYVHLYWPIYSSQYISRVQN